MVPFHQTRTQRLLAVKGRPMPPWYLMVVGMRCGRAQASETIVA